MENAKPIADGRNKNFGLIMLLYVFGLFIGALSTGIVTPARTIIQASLGVDDKTGIWMINIFTLAYAAAIPIAGKLADKLGRKNIYIVSIVFFGLGSAICGLSGSVSSFALLLAGRVVQAIGGGGIMPIATAEFGTSFPPEKRGMALGLIGGVYGLANILGSTAGSAILDAAGTGNWKWLFYINVPICLLIIAGSAVFMANNRADEVRKIDKLGILVLVTIILSLLYGLKAINFFDFAATIKSSSAYPYLIAAAVLIPVFVLIERKAEDPILNLKYFTNTSILITLILSFIVGVSMMGMIFVPQFSENALKIPTGSGGYFVAVLGVFAGIAAPLSGKLIDSFGVKKILAAGFIIATAGGLFLAYVAINNANLLTVCTSLVIIGLGMGFTMGTPLNYMMLQNTPKSESNSALAALSLIRSVGTAIAPAIMIGFIAQAGLNMQDNLMNMLPMPTAPKIAQAGELTRLFEDLKATPQGAEMLKDVNMPDFDKMGNMDFDMSGGGKIPEDVLKSLQTADVTNITDRTKDFAARMMEDNMPPVIVKIQNGVQTGAEKMKQGLAGMDKAISDMQKGIKGIDTAIAQMSKGYNGISAAVAGMQNALKQQDAALAQMEKMYSAVKQGSGMTTAISMPPKSADGSMPSNGKMPPGAAMPTGEMMNADTLKAQLGELSAAREKLAAKLAETMQKRDSLDRSIKTARAKKQQLSTAIAQMEQQRTALAQAISKMEDFRAAVPAAFEQSKTDYLQSIEKMRPQIEDTFQSTMNGGFRQMFLAVSIASFIGLLILLFYKASEPAVVQQTQSQSEPIQ